MRSRTACAGCLILGAASMFAVSPPAGATPPSDKNQNGGTVELTCDDGGTVQVWVNGLASDRSGESPALVVSGADGRVFKVKSFTYLGETYPLRFPAPESLTLVTCTHPFDGDTVTLVGALIP